ncbi:MAG: Phosphoserine aminotransferase [uncultured Acidimicrobiales bacterium]|uniref:phosphoserine transaminase n=1 Tax=uncultured Acidimicrobiales bacterium TaxID=310071 RepID=A0A6J4HMS3_9ACTN|nr:MAG: Phosphoserine aminotransferase [uncultured Acidimicrobiales bacterium]
MSSSSPDITIPADLRPSDGRFGSGPSKVRADAMAALVAAAPTYLGTSHRQSPVKSVVGRLRAGMGELFALPEGFEVVFGNGGAAYFWDVALFSLIERRSQHLSFGNFSESFTTMVANAAHLDSPDVIESPAGTHPEAKPNPDVDAYALTHNETSTGVAMEVLRPAPAEEGLVLVDATSAAGGMRVDPGQFDVYYFSPQKGFGSDGGLWIALCSPAALARVDKIKATGRWIPESLSLATAIENARLNQTYNTPGLATLFLMCDQLEWILANGGLEWAASRCETSTNILYGWAEKSDFATPFVADHAARSPVVATIDLDDSIDAKAVTKVLRANGIVDTEPYRRLGRNQLRVAVYPSVEPDDVALLTGAIDHVVSALS